MINSTLYIDIVSILSMISVAVIKYHDEKELGEEIVYFIRYFVSFREFMAGS